MPATVLVANITFNPRQPSQLLRDNDVAVLSQMDSRKKDWYDWQQFFAEVETLMGYFSDSSDLVCDPRAGSFSTAVAARSLGRPFVGCDVEQESVKISHFRNTLKFEQT